MKLEFYEKWQGGDIKYSDSFYIIQIEGVTANPRCRGKRSTHDLVKPFFVYLLNN